MRALLTSLKMLLAGLLVLASTAHAETKFTTANVSSVVREGFALREFSDIDLPQGSVRAVHVCQRGFLWAGTREGLVQYKSGQQRVWQQTADGISGLPSGMVNDIYEDWPGHIWVATVRGVAVKENGADDFRIVVQSERSREKPLDIVSLVPVSDFLLAVSASGELLRLDQNGAQLLTAGIGFNGMEQAPLESQIFTTAAASGDNLFIGTVASGIYRLTMNRDQYTVQGKVPTTGAVVSMEVADDTLLWLSRDTGMNWLPLGSDEQPSTIDPMADSVQGYYRAMAVRSPRSAWFGSGPNVVRVRGDKAEVVRLPGRGNEVRSVTIDRAGNIWIGTYYGLYYALDTEFSTLRTASGEASGVVSSIATNGEKLFIGGQNLWVGGLDSAQYPELATTYGTEGLPNLRVNPLSIGQDPITALDAHGDLLIVGYYVGGFDVIDLGNGQVSNFTQLNGQSLENIGVSGVVRINENTWLATFYYLGLVELTINRTDGAPRISARQLNTIQTLIGVYRISESTFLAVHEQGLLRIERTTDDTYRVDPFSNSPLGLIFALAPDGYGGAYLGVENVGVRHLTSDMVHNLRLDPRPLKAIEPYLARRTVWHLVLDDQDELWVTTNNGVYVFDLPREALRSHVTYQDGLAADEFEYGPNASLKLPNGDKVFVSSAGPVSFRDIVPARNTPINLGWTKVSIDGQAAIEKLQKIDDHHFTLDVPFSAVSQGVLRLEYSYDDHIKAQDATYALRFSEEQDWLPGGLPAISLTGHQDWGPVDVAIAMLDGNGDVISSPLNIGINVAPPPYVLWFLDLRIAIPVVIGIAILLLLVQWRARYRQQLAVADAERKREVFEAEMRGRLSEKEILLREIHHRVGNILSNFAANVRTMQRSATNEETRDTLEHLNARIKVQSAVHLLLQRSDSTDINVAHIIRQVVSGARDLHGTSDSRPINLEIEDLYLRYSKAQYLGLIINEMLTNSYKYALDSQATDIASISLTRSADGSATLTYRDYGSGLDRKAIERAMADDRGQVRGGLIQVIAMARELKGEPELWSDEGVHLRIRIPSKLIRDPVRDQSSVS